MQFLARERTYPKVDNRIILLDGRAIGRILVDRRETLILLADIALLKEYRNAGIGSSLVRDLMKEAAAVNKPLKLHVLQNSPAVRLYERLGFCQTGFEAAYVEMTWSPVSNKAKDQTHQPDRMSYRLNPYISLVESRLFPEFTQHAVFHRLTGELYELSGPVRSLLAAANLGNRVPFTEEELHNMGDLGKEINALIKSNFLIQETFDPLTRLLKLYVARPMQNPALIYRSKTGEWILVRTSMEHTVYSRKRDELPVVIEEALPPLTSEIFLLADGTRTLEQIFSTVQEAESNDILKHAEFRKALDFLTAQKRQLIKLTSQADDINEPFKPVNIVPRNLYHSDRWNEPLSPEPGKTISDFHLEGIEDASWEFDQIEPTVNHCFRFPHEALGGLDYGSRFCISTFRPDILPLMDHSSSLNVLEVGGGTGSFARSFIQQALKLEELGNGPHVNYHILDLSPALIENQKKLLSELLPESRHFQQDAIEFDLPEHTFDLIISNEVIADFPVASIVKSEDDSIANAEGQKWQGDGVYYLEKYDLSDKDAPNSFLVNAGAFRFLERAWKHLIPGGTLIVSEYGTEQHYPARSFHLNHDEYTIHFGHLLACASKIGFQCKLMTLVDFLELDTDVLVLNGREEHILCLNYVFKNYGLTLPFAVISKSQFEHQCQEIADEMQLTGYSFLPLKKRYHFGPNVEDFLVLIMNKPG
jgi:SAM-dependent methyltransferase/N-acetylglutamate synthase-like GNAT family acetyltransferase